MIQRKKESDFDGKSPQEEVYEQIRIIKKR